MLVQVDWESGPTEIVLNWAPPLLRLAKIVLTIAHKGHGRAFEKTKNVFCLPLCGTVTGRQKH